MAQRVAAAATYRPAVDDDRGVIRAFVERDLAGTPYATVVEYFLRLASVDPGTESRVIVAERGGVVVGFVVFGEVAGAIGTGRVHFVSVTTSARSQGVGVGLCEAAVADLSANEARVVVAEVPDEPSFLPGRTLFTRCGFVEIARVADYVRDGTDLVVLARGTGRER